MAKIFRKGATTSPYRLSSGGVGIMVKSHYRGATLVSAHTRSPRHVVSAVKALKGATEQLKTFEGRLKRVGESRGKAHASSVKKMISYYRGEKNRLGKLVAMKMKRGRRRR